MSYNNSKIWQKAFSGGEDGNGLAVAYAAAWSRASSIAKFIARDAPGLTLHDEQHFSALWRSVDHIAGDEITLSPAEAFILGMAILVHDAAHTVLAFEGGLEAVKATPEWADALTLRLPEGADAEPITPEIEGGVLFETLRNLHASQATDVLAKSFKHPALGTDFYILTDPTLRGHFSERIGEIAASHHWDLSKLERLGNSWNAPFPYDNAPVRPILLAALLRTADAIQIDQSRAPDFDFALTNPRGISNDHWTAQNRIGVAPDRSDASALLVTSSSAFKEEHAGAWWVAYDLAKAADKELRQTDLLLRDRGLGNLALNHVKDVSSPERFASHVRAEGWKPVPAEVTVSDTKKLISIFGGVGLYGNDPVVPLREILQNATDAIYARRALKPEFDGKIVVELEEGRSSSGKEGIWLRVIDDGLGMSQTILTGPLLTFGETGWTSSALRAERPGFVGKRFRHIGRYGIGFFSAFMIASEVVVTSRSFEAGADSARQLIFKDGLGLRPIVKPVTMEMDRSTSVELFLSAEQHRWLMHRRESRVVFKPDQGAVEMPEQAYLLDELIGVLCVASDVAVYVKPLGESRKLAVPNTWKNEEPASWISRVKLVDSLDFPEVVRANLDALSPVIRDEVQVGRAMLNPTTASLGVTAIGGFGRKITESHSSGSSFIGVINTDPLGPRRDQGNTDHAAVAAWANAQVANWSKRSISDQEMNFVAANASVHGGDPSPIANCIVDGEWYTLGGLLELMKAKGKVFAPIRSHGSNGGWYIGPTVNLESGFLHHPDDVKVDRERVMLSGETGEIKAYWKVPDDERTWNANSFLACFDRYVRHNGYGLQVALEKIDFGFYCGETSRRQLKTHGDRIEVPGLELTLLPIPK